VKSRWTATAMCALVIAGGCSSDRNSGAVSLSIIGDRAALVTPSTAQGLVAFDADGQLEPALAERWIVSDDGLSLAFRLARTTWTNNKPIIAADVVYSLKQSFARAPQGRLGQLFSAVEDVVPMTDRVIEIRLKQPRPNMLQLLAQPEFGVTHMGMGAGPYTADRPSRGYVTLHQVKARDGSDDSLSDEQLKARDIKVRGESAALAIARYTQGQAQAVLRGTFETYPLVRAAQIQRNKMIIDPAQGLFGLAFVSHSTFTGDPALREALSMVLDRPALGQLLDLPNGQMRETILPAQLDSAAPPTIPDWTQLGLADRRAEAALRIRKWAVAHKGTPQIRLAQMDGPGGRLLFARLAADWRMIGVTVLSASKGEPADLRLIDEVAPSASANWYFTRLSCEMGVTCDKASKAALAMARESQTLAGRALAYSQTDEAYARNAPFIPLGNPYRWNLTSAGLVGLHPSPFATHPLIHLRG